MSSFQDNNLSWAEHISQMLDELSELLSDYTYDFVDQTDIILKETEIYEFIDEYVPRLLPDIDDFFNYIHESIRNNETLDEVEIENYIMTITRRLHRRDNYTRNYLNYSDDRSKYELDVASNIRSQTRATEQEYISRIINSDQNYDEEVENNRYVTQAERFAQAKERKQNTINFIIQYLNNHSSPVSISQLRHNVAIASRQVINIIRKQPQIIDYKEALLLGSKLQISQAEKDALKNAVLDTFFIDKIHSSEEIYRQLLKTQKTLITELFIDNSYQCFSVLQYLFPNDFVFVRPRIALPGQTLTKPIESITRFIHNRYKTNIEDLNEFIEDAGYDITVSLSLINKIPDVILIDRNTLISKSNLTLTNNQLIQIITLIQDELREDPEEPDTIAIRDLSCSAQFPALNLPITEWLLYSILTKWDWPGKKSGQALYAFYTSPYLSRAIPIVSTNQTIDKEIRQAIAAQYEGTGDTKMAIDDLSKLDELIEDEIEFDWDLEALEEEEDEEI